ncbi:hypothetical protein Tco_1335417 [Tanacetum coccineum]
MRHKIEDQPLPAVAFNYRPFLGYYSCSDPKRDPRRIMLDYPADGGDGDDEPSDDNDDDDDAGDEDEKASEDENDDEEEEHLAPADSSAVHIVDPVLSAGDTEAFKTNEKRLTDFLPYRKTVRLEPPMSASMEARIAEHAAAPTPPLPVAPPPSPLPSPLTTSLTDAGAPLGYRAARIRIRVASPSLLLPSTSYMTDIPEAEMLPQKTTCFTTPAPRLEIRESLAAGVARQPGPTLEADTWDEILEAMMEDDRAFLRARVNTLFRDRQYHLHTARALDREAIYARIAWTGSEDRSAAIEAHVRTLEAHVATLIAQTTSLQTQLTTTLGRIKTLKARDPEPQDEPAEAGSRCSHLSFVAILYSLLSFMGYSQLIFDFGLVKALSCDN